jgi:hypothetical protein
MMAKTIQPCLAKAITIRAMQEQAIPMRTALRSPNSLVAGPGKNACTKVWQTPNVPSERPIQRPFQRNVSKPHNAQQLP